MPHIVYFSISEFTKTKTGTFEVEIENGAQRMMEKLSNMSGASPAKYVGTGDRDEKFLINILLRENISCTSKIEPPYYSVVYYAMMCIYGGVGRTQRTLNKSVEHCLQCQR